MASEVGSAYVTLLPSAKGFASKMQKELAGEVSRAGRAAGDDYGDAFSREANDGIKSRGKGLFKGLGGMAAGALAGVGIGSFIGDALGEARDAVVVGARTSNVIKSMGNVAGISATQVGDLAAKLSNKTAVDDEAIQSGQNLLLTFGNLRNEAGKGNDIFNQTSALMVDMSAAMGTDLKGSAIQLGKALNDPTKGMSQLGRVGVSFTEQQKEQVKRLQESGDVLGAQKVILGEVKRQFSGAAATMATPADRAKVAWGNFQESMGTVLLPLVDKVLNKAADWLPVIGNFATKVGAELGPALARARDLFAAVFGFLRNNQTTVAVVAGAIGALVAVTAAHNAVLAISSGRLRAWIVQTRIVQAVTKAWAAVQWVINAAMSANPIGLLVVAVAALIAIVVLVIKKLGGWDAVMAKLGKAWDRFKAMMSRVWTSVKDAVVKGVNAVVGWLKGLPGKALAAVKALGSKLKGFFSGVWDTVKSLTVRAVTGYVSFYAKLPGRLVSALKSIGGKLADLFRKAWDTAKNAVGNGIDSVVSAVKKLPDKLRNLGGSFLSAGKAIIGKFVDGLKNAAGIVSGIAGNVWTAVKGMLNQAIDKINSALEFTINLPGPKDLRVDVANIPHLATGARATGATLAVIGEGREPETVLPDSMLRGLLDRAAAGDGERVAELTITNWEQGTGYFRLVANGAVNSDARFRRTLGAMNA
jgi:hypothetical protein